MDSPDPDERVCEKTVKPILPLPMELPIARSDEDEYLDGVERFDGEEVTSGRRGSTNWKADDPDVTEAWLNLLLLVSVWCSL